jgi:thioredoxin 1
MKSVFYFTADWCGPCKMVRPIVEELKSEGFFIQIIDVDTEIELAQKFKIKSIPTFILFEDQNEINTIIGAQTKQSLIGFINGK